MKGMETCPLGWFARAAVTHYYKLDGFKQCKCIQEAKPPTAVSPVGPFPEVLGVSQLLGAARVPGLGSAVPRALLLLPHGLLLPVSVSSPLLVRTGVLWDEGSPYSRMTST